MKVKAFMRVAQTGRGYKVAASSKANQEPLFRQDYRGKEFLPTVSFAVVLNIPEELFNQAEKEIAEINLALNEVEIAAEVDVPASAKKKK